MALVKGRDWVTTSSAPQEEATRGEGHVIDAPRDYTDSRQPYLHDRLIVLDAPGMWISPSDGQIRNSLDGVYAFDRRLLTTFVLQVGSEEPTPIGADLDGAHAARFTAIARRHCDPVTPDPKVLVSRRRAAAHDGGTEHIAVTNYNRNALDTVVELELAADLATISDVKAGRSAMLRAPEYTAGQLRWADHTMTVAVGFDPTPDSWDGALARWHILIPASESFNLTVTVSGTSTASSTPSFRVRGSERPAPWHEQPPTVHAEDPRLAELLDRSLADLEALLLCDAEAPDDQYLAAGAPWFLTLFGRDSLWAARMLLPLSSALAGSTLRTLARWQGTHRDPLTSEAPGAIVHELRQADSAHFLPAAYYGTIDATPLFVTLATEAWRWGLPDEQIEELLPAIESALDWMANDGDPDRDGFLEYAQHDGGLRNQGWKDSADSIQWRDGRLASGPIALSEVQAYAHEAAANGARLLDAFDRPGSDRWLTWAEALRARFGRTFWLADADGPYVAVGLDGDNQPIDSVTSNMGHLLGTGLLHPDEEASVARRLRDERLSSGWGVRTLARDAAGFNPVGYHNGSVWPHDTAINALGLSRSGYGDQAADLMCDLLDAAAAFDYRLPELYGGNERVRGSRPGPYPASCRPQAWAAASTIVLLEVLAGLHVDAPARQLELRPSLGRIGTLEVRGLHVGTNDLAFLINRDGTTRILDHPFEPAQDGRLGNEAGRHR